MACVSNHRAFFRECLQRVTWDEPCRLDLVFVEELEHPTYPHCSCEETFEIKLRFSLARSQAHTSGYITRRVLATGNS